LCKKFIFQRFLIYKFKIILFPRDNTRNLKNPYQASMTQWKHFAAFSFVYSINNFLSKHGKNFLWSRQMCAIKVVKQTAFTTFLCLCFHISAFAFCHLCWRQFKMWMLYRRRREICELFLEMILTLFVSVDSNNENTSVLIELLIKGCTLVLWEAIAFSHYNKLAAQMRWKACKLFKKMQIKSYKAIKL
jgi:hypothetical protein